LLVYAALYALITSHALGVPLPSDAIIQPTESMSQANDAGMHNHNEMEIASDILQGLLHADTNSEMPLEQHACLKKIDQLLEQTKNALSTRRTAKLWLQYLSMVEILQKFIKAERIGDWQLHLHALAEMLPFFAAAGHFHYAKSARLYLQFMQSLDTIHPDVYQNFMSGLHVIRRSDRCWAGLSTDLVIEQVLMRSLKTTGGLTRGTGISETQRLVWLLSMPMCAEISYAMQAFSGVEYSTSEQHVDISKSRQSRDTEDTLKVLQFLTIQSIQG